MRTAQPGGELAVAVGEVFGIVRRGRETSGYRLSAEVPEGVERLPTQRGEAAGFGGRPEVVERFRCTRSGRYRIALAEGRPWEAAAPLGDVIVQAD